MLTRDEKDFKRTILPIAGRYQEIVTTWARYTDPDDELEDEELVYEQLENEEDDDADWIPNPVIRMTPGYYLYVWNLKLAAMIPASAAVERSIKNAI